MKNIFRILYKAYFALYFGFSLAVFYPFFKILLMNKMWWPKAFILMRFYAKLWLQCTGVRVSIKGTDNIPKSGSYIICANHSSFVDIPSTYYVFKNYFVFTGKKEIKKWPLFRIFYTSGMNILVDRNHPTVDMSAFRKMMGIIDQNIPLVIFPEGTISKKAPEPGEFKPGFAILAIQKGVPILPVTFTQNWKRLQRKGLFKGLASPGKTEAIIHPVINTTELSKKDVKALVIRCKEIISEPLEDSYLM